MNENYFSDKKINIDWKDKSKIILLGNPNVGKSVIFGYLTGKYVTVSNYPGTTVEISQGISSLKHGSFVVIDTPGINSLIPNSEDEKVTRDILLEEKIENIIQVADAKNIKRALFITLQLAEAGLPFMMVLNMDDEAKSRGIIINQLKLSNIIGVEVISATATQKIGLKNIVKNVPFKKFSNLNIKYDAKIENTLSQISFLLPSMNVSKRFFSLMLISGDKSLLDIIRRKISGEDLIKIDELIKRLESQYSFALSYIINQAKINKIREIINNVLTEKERKQNKFLGFFDHVTMHPVWGIPFALIVLYIIYQIVGVFAAGTLVDFFESVVFEKYLNPYLIKIVKLFIPFNVLQEFFVGQYGILTMALTYSLAIVLPIVTFFFIVFAFLEDSGYLPRLAVMMNKIFKFMGLNGKAVLPMILGLGCDTMATLVTRILPSKKERIITTLLLALAIPCSAQLGVIFGETAAISSKAVIIWIVTMLFVIFSVGYLSSKILPGSSSDFILEIPPIRVPVLSNLVIKTLARLEWYLKEAVPYFMLGTAILFVFQKLKLLNLIENITAPIFVNLLSLPKEVAGAFVLGFLRRDYAAVLLVKNNILTPVQMLVSVITITLFIPCIAQFFIMIKERGLKTAIFIFLFVFFFAFSFGGLFNFIIRYLGVTL